MKCESVKNAVSFIVINLDDICYRFGIGLELRISINGKNKKL